VELGVCVASHVGDIDYVARAEALGYSHAWFADSQMLWSDCYACLALAAQRTSRIRLGTGVAIAGTRPPSVNAAGIATINALAPGRTFFGIGAGNTAMRVMGQPPVRIREFERYLEEVIPLVRGEEAISQQPGGDLPIRHVMPDRGFVNFAAPVPVYVSGFGPRSLGLAGRFGDGAVLANMGHPAVMERCWKYIEAGAGEAGRGLDRATFHTTSLTAITVLKPGEPPDSDRVIEQCGPMALASLHYAYDQWRNFGQEPPPYARPVWSAYTALLERCPEERRHQRIHAGHNCWVLPEERQFLGRELLEATCMIGTREELAGRLSALAGAGLDQVMILPGFDARYEALEEVATLMPLLS
jgi:alkanesulfonate monooxygenase SsuD/methylene tetrahydromethanopterin reductase-like flavin-dependent oxidoreductase (luciferase family)